MLTALAAVFPIAIAIAVISGLAYLAVCLGHRLIEILLPSYRLPADRGADE